MNAGLDDEAAIQAAIGASLQPVSEQEEAGWGEPEPEPELEMGLEGMSAEGQALEAAAAAEGARRDRSERLAEAVANGGGLADAHALAVTGLMEAPFVVLDGFAGLELCAAIRREVQQLDEQGELKVGELGGGQTGANLMYHNAAVRGDRVGWFDGDE